MSVVLKEGNTIEIQGWTYTIKGGIVFHNLEDGCQWTEFKLVEVGGGKVRWLSVDNIYNEYGMYEQKNLHGDCSVGGMQAQGHRLVDAGTAVVKNAFGQVDVDIHDQVQFYEYEDHNKLIGIEVWEDETEYSEGYPIKAGEIHLINDNSSTTQFHRQGANQTKWVWIGIIGIFVGALLAYLMSSKNVIATYLSKSSDFQYVTSITSDTYTKEKAQVYQTTFDRDTAAKKIIEGIDGKTVDVEKSEEDGSIAILTDREYCYVYEEETGKSYVQVSSRLYSYTSTSSAYRSTGSFYRRYYFSRGYDTDAQAYKKYSSAYGNYDGTRIPSNPQGEYNVYANTVRQSSVGSRSSSGGGISFGK